MGTESWKAAWMPIEALVAPGPRVTDQHAGLAGELRVGVGQ